jgi:hypothetical protein
MKYTPKRQNKPQIILASSALIFIFSGYELWTGWVVSVNSIVTREANPGLYWFIVTFHMGLGLTTLVVAITKWRRLSGEDKE